MASKAESARDPESGAWWDESASPHTRPPPQPQHGQQQYNPPRHYIAPPMDTTRGNNAYNDGDDRGFDWDRVAHIVLAVLLPPLGVFFQTGCNKDFAINVLLTLLGYIPGIIHALYVILTA